MASVKKTRSGTFQLRVKNKLLPKVFWATFDTHEQATQYGEQLERLLAQGIVPASLLEQGPPKRSVWTIGRCIVEYLRHNPVPVSDVKLLDTIRPDLELVGTGSLNYDWADSWIRAMKREVNLAPSTIRHRHGALARCFEWMLRKHPEILAQNPLRLLKRGFWTYTDDDAEVLARSGKESKCDVERDRRLLPDEEAAILGVLDGDERVLFVLAGDRHAHARMLYARRIAGKPGKAHHLSQTIEEWRKPSVLILGWEPRRARARSNFHRGVAPVRRRIPAGQGKGLALPRFAA